MNLLLYCLVAVMMRATLKLLLKSRGSSLNFLHHNSLEVLLSPAIVHNVAVRPPSARIRAAAAVFERCLHDRRAMMNS